MEWLAGQWPLILGIRPFDSLALAQAALQFDKLTAARARSNDERSRKAGFISLAYPEETGSGERKVRHP
ncbi:MAG: hypothetical protein MUE47_06330, partial [Acidobacteria bacterium]|nr:hypothetical protein [Acidobacteriota bacterium]